MRRSSSLALHAVLLYCLLLPALALAQELRPSSQAELRARHTALQPQLASNPFRGPLHIESNEGSRSVRGDVFAVMDHPFATVSAALDDPRHWCDVMILHLNTKFCRGRTDGGPAQLELRIGKKHDQPLLDAPRVLFSWHGMPPAPDYMNVQLDAAEGPFDTRDYRILLEAVPLDSKRTFIHLGYSFGFGTASRLALRLYLSTLARDKVGFSSTASNPGGEPGYVGGVRGMVERNTMRYYLAIEAYLGALSLPPGVQAEKRFQAWFDTTEKYARQLHEIDREQYLDMKRREYRRQLEAN